MKWHLGDFYEDPSPIGIFVSCDDHPEDWVYLEPWYDCEDNFDSHSGHIRNWKMLFV